MPPIKLQHVISFTSEDPRHKIENLLTGNGIWLCSSNEHSGSIKVEFQLDKATTIDFIDIGNQNSAMVCIEVGMSSWPTSQSFVSLLPTVVLMSPSDCRSGLNSKTVRMFKKGDLDKDNALKKWDRIRVICSQPFRKNTQYGLAFLKLHSQGDLPKENRELCSPRENKRKRESLFSCMTPQRSPVVMSESLQSLEKCRMNSGEDSNSLTSSQYSAHPITSPISRAGRLVMARKYAPNEVDGKKEKKALECDALTFLISMNLTNEDIHSLKVSYIREEFEIRRKQTLNTREKQIFKNIALDYAAERIKSLQKQKVDDVPLTLSSDDENEMTGTSKVKNNFSFKNTKVKLFPKAGAERGRDTSLLPAPSCDSRNELALIDSVVTPNKRKERKRNRSPENEESTGCRSSSSKNNSKALKSDSSNEVCFDISLLSPDKGSGDPFPLSHGAPLQGRHLGTKLSNKFGSFGHENEEGAQPGPPLSLVQCPLCTGNFSSGSIEAHAANCEGELLISPIISPVQTVSQTSVEECPICGCFLTSFEIKGHAEECAERTFL